MAGRHENPVDRTVPARATLADLQRERRKSSGLTYAEMKCIVGISATTLKRAASGKETPTPRTVWYWVNGTDPLWRDTRRVSTQLEKDRKHAVQLWLRARRAESGTHVYKAPDPLLVADMAGFGQALRDLHVWAGSPSAHLMEAKAGNHHVLPHTTAHRIVRGLTVPANEAQLLGFLHACDVETSEIDYWREAWERVKKTYVSRRRRTAEGVKRMRIEAEQNFDLFSPFVTV